MKENPLFILRPNLINAFFPTLLKYFFKIIIYAGLPLIILGIILNILKIISFNNYLMAFIIIFTSIIIATISLAIKIFILLPKLEYRFYNNHFEVESKLLNIEKKSVPYNKIVNINANISLWDRISHAGDLIIHTADEKETGDIHLLFLKNPLDVEKKIHDLILKTNK